MVIGIVGQIANVGIRYTSRYLKQLHRYDVAIHKGLYGASAGRGVRHGRDAGIFISQYVTGGDIEPGEDVPQQPPVTSRKFSKTYRGYKRFDSRSKREYDRCRKYRNKPRYSGNRY